MFYSSWITQVYPVYASDIGVGGLLLQEDTDEIDHPVCYFSRKLNKHQKIYSTIEKECLALLLSLQHFEVDLSACSSDVIVYTDRNPFTFIKTRDFCGGVCYYRSIIVIFDILEVRIM